jgi:hypothetical protein
METIASPTTVPPTVNPMKLPPSASSAPHEPHRKSGSETMLSSFPQRIHITASSTSRGSVDKPKQSPTNASPPFKPVVSAAPAPQSQRSRAVSSTPFGYVSALRSTDAEDEALFQLPPRPQDVSPSYITVRPGQRPPSFVPPAQSPRSAGFEADYGCVYSIHNFVAYCTQLISRLIAGSMGLMKSSKVSRLPSRAMLLGFLRDHTHPIVTGRSHLCHRWTSLSCQRGSRPECPSSFRIRPQLQ